MSYMLDTNICIHLMRHTQSVIEKFSEIRENSIAISAITLSELEFGICNNHAYEKNRVKLISFLPLVDILSFDDRAAVDYGFIRADLQKKGIVIGPLDMLIAAHARSRNLVLVTNNKNEFERVEGLSVIDWV